MTDVNMTQVTKMITHFRDMQRKHKVRDSSNMIQNKWDMRDVMSHIDEPGELETLIKFFFMMSDDKTFTHFFQQYSNYYDSMVSIRLERAHRRQLAQDTLKKGKG